MAKYFINPAETSGREVVADHFLTVGDFVDFFEGPSHDSPVVLRMRAKDIFLIERAG